jgi:hypothetical protein
MTLFERRINPREAPPGFFAVLKSDVATQELGNICRACDWRPDCTGFEHRCMSYTIIGSRDGSKLKRNDGCSVVFKRVAVVKTDKAPNAGYAPSDA